MYFFDQGKTVLGIDISQKAVCECWLTFLNKSQRAQQNRFVFDASAREIKALAARGLVEIVSEHYAADHEGALITDMVFVKIR